MRLAALLPLALLLGAKGPGPYRRADFDKEVEPFGLSSVDARPADLEDGTLVAQKLVKACVRLTGMRYLYPVVRCTLPDKNATDLVFFFGAGEGWQALAWVDHGAPQPSPVLGEPLAWSEDFSWAFPLGGHFDRLDHIAGVPAGQVFFHHYYSDVYGSFSDVPDDDDVWTVLRPLVKSGRLDEIRARVAALRGRVPPESIALYEAYVDTLTRLGAAPKPGRVQFAELEAWVTRHLADITATNAAADGLPAAERAELIARYELLRDKLADEAVAPGLAGSYAGHLAAWLETGVARYINAREYGARYNPVDAVALQDIAQQFSFVHSSAGALAAKDWPAARTWLMGLYDTNFYHRPDLAVQAIDTYVTVRPLLLAEAARVERLGLLATAAELYAADVRLVATPEPGEAASADKAAALYQRMVLATVPAVDAAAPFRTAWFDRRAPASPLWRRRDVTVDAQAYLARVRAAAGEVWTAVATEPRVGSVTVKTGTRTDEGSYVVDHTATNPDYEFWTRRRDAALAALREVDALAAINAGTANAGDYTADSSITDVYTHTDGSAPDVIRQGGGPSGASFFHADVQGAVNAALQERRRPLAARLAAIEAERPSETETTHEERRATYVREEQSWVVQIAGELVVRGGGSERRLVAPTNGLYLSTQIATAGQASLGVAAMNTFTDEASIRREATDWVSRSLVDQLADAIDARIRDRVEALALPGVSADDLAQERTLRLHLLVDRSNDMARAAFDLDRVPFIRVGM